MKQDTNFSIDKTTEEKIKVAAEKIFFEKGYSATRTRDIADEAGINIALLNYYFRSKENLYSIILMKKIDGFLDIMIDVLRDKSVGYPDKITVLIHKYMDLMMKDQHLALFLLGEVQRTPDFFISRLNVRARTQGVFFGDVKERYQIQLLLDFMGLTFFPFIVRDAIEKLYEISHEAYDEILNERKEYIPRYFNEIYNIFAQR